VPESITLSVNPVPAQNTPMASTTDLNALKQARLRALALTEDQFAETFSRSSGPGGQHVNKVSTAVTVRHLPTGLSVTAQDSRSQSMNRHLAWSRLFDSIAAARKAEREARVAEREKERRRTAPRPWGLKQTILKEKKKRGEVKRSRGRVDY
jgi:protein subunit release factor B